MTYSGSTTALLEIVKDYHGVAVELDAWLCAGGAFDTVFPDGALSVIDAIAVEEEEFRGVDGIFVLLSIFEVIRRGISVVSSLART